MAFTKVDKIWMNGEFVNWDDAKIHVLSHVVHYGSSMFEGLRCYNTKKGPAIFHLKEHTKRLFNSCKIYRMEIPYTAEELNEVQLELVRINKLDSCYLRPVVYRGYDSLGVDPRSCPVEIAIAAWSWGQYLGPEALEQGVDVCVSSWNRMAPNTFPAMAKCGANYMNSQLIKLEALSHGYSEGIALDHNGMVSEGSGENLFIVRRGALITPPFSASILPGITRRTVIQLAKEMGIQVIERNIPREALYIAEEVFFTGSAAEITPIKSVDKITIGEGGRGPITKKLQEAFFDIVEEGNDPHGFLSFVYETEAVKA
ncbi:MAG: branched-chain amino acid transaminase [candidate division Zixibacteria bacterium]|nr:branched-chain amino acid transaminase [candidate division Zixibacteria bacterium]